MSNLFLNLITSDKIHSTVSVRRLSPLVALHKNPAQIQCCNVSCRSVILCPNSEVKLKVKLKIKLAYSRSYSYLSQQSLDQTQQSMSIAHDMCLECLLIVILIVIPLHSRHPYLLMKAPIILSSRDTYPPGWTVMLQ